MAVPARTSLRRSLLALGVLAPWAWFLVRDLSPALNAVAVVLPALGVGTAVVLLVIAGLARRLLPALMAVSVACMTAVAIIEPRRAYEPTPPAVPITIAFANVYDDNHAPEEAVEDLLARGTDIVVAVEATGPFRDAIEVADTEHRFQVDDGQLLVHATWPIQLLEPPDVLPVGRAMLVRVNPPQVSPVSVLVLHAPNPSSATTFEAQTHQVERIERFALDLAADGPVVIVGDLNLSDRTSGYRSLDANFRDVMRAGATAHNTYAGGVWRLAMLRIDHLFVGRSWCASEPDVFDVSGSDHRGLQAVIGPCP